MFTSPLKSKSAANVAKSLETIILANNLHISVCQSDGGTEFLAEVQDLFEKYGIKHITSKPASPWTNGCIERVWGTIKQMLYKYQSITGRENWVAILPKLTESYNNTYHRSIGKSPTEAFQSPSKVPNQGSV